MEYNKIKITHTEGNRFATDKINIDIENCSYGSLKLLMYDLNELFLKQDKNNDHMVAQAYSNLLHELSKALAKKLIR